MKTLLISTLLAAMPLAALAASSPDESFYKKAAEAGMGEVELGNLAAQKTPDPQLRDFATMMVKDHTAANEKLRALAASKNISLPSGAGVMNAAEKAKLDVLKGDTFDKSYIKSQVKAHKETVELLNKEIASGQDPDAKAFAQSVLPTVRSHLKAIDSIAATKNIKT
jgi:putative membrane protein